MFEALPLSLSHPSAIIPQAWLWLTGWGPPTLLPTTNWLSSRCVCLSVGGG